MQLSTNQEGGVMSFSAPDFIAGLAVNGAFGNVNFTSPAIGKGAEKLQNINPFTAYGILQPGRAATNVTNNAQLGGVVIAGVVQGAQFAYLVDGAGKVHQYDYTSKTITNAGSFPHTIAGTAPVGQDAIVYKHNVGGVAEFSVFYSYYNNANWNVGAYVNLTTFSDAYMSTTPATPLVISSGDGDDTTQRTSPHCLEIGADDVLYIGSGRYIHAYDGTNGNDGTFTSKVLTLPLGFSVVALKKYQNVMLIAGNYNTDVANNVGGEALLYIWNYIDLDITQSISLEDPVIVSLFLWKGIPYVITVGEIEGRGINKLKALVGNNVTLKTTFNLVPPINRGVDPSSDVLFINCGGKIVQIGDPFTGQEITAHQPMSCVSSGVSGWIKNLGIDLTTASSNPTNYGLLASGATAISGGTNSLCTFLTNWNISGIFITPNYEVPCPPGKQARLKNIIIEHFRIFTLADLSLTTYYNMQNDSSVIFSNLATLAVPLTKQYKLDSSNAPLKPFTSLGFQLIWNTSATTSSLPPGIARIHFVFEYINLIANS